MFPRSPTQLTPCARLASGRWLNVRHEGHRAMPFETRVSHACAQYQHATRTSADPRAPTYATPTAGTSQLSPHARHPTTGLPSRVYPTTRYSSWHAEHSFDSAIPKSPSHVEPQNARNAASGASQ